MKAVIHIELKPGVLDPQGRTIARSLAHMGFGGVTSARQGKTIELELDTEDAGQARIDVEKMCNQLLANVVIEDYQIEIIDKKIDENTEKSTE
ncbi:MAG: phosphoribosylformylglycinamidine synthase [Robiginitomaculum sp.]|nr:MAG: phosphoribosylformylglycinamidine synthase [Robiginitomaculum sp.]